MSDSERAGGAQARRWLLTMGSALLTDDGRGLSNYDEAGGRRITGCSFRENPELIRRGNLVPL